jgi:hypothetical protein
MKLPLGSFFFGVNMQYTVGQIIYLLGNKSLTILPALIVEEVTRKTIEEQTKQYVLELPGENKKRVVLDSINERIFNDIGELRSHMIENTKQSIEKLIDNAMEKKELFFGKSNIDLQSASKSEKVKKKIMTDTEKHVQKDVKDIIMNSKDNKTKNKEGK